MPKIMFEVYTNTFTVNPQDIRKTPETERQVILAELKRNLELSQEECERTLRPPTDTVMMKAMTE